MRLLFDENLSPQLGRLLAKEFPGSIHIRAAELTDKTDISVRAFAKAHGLVIATRDFDFVELVDVLGSPPYVIYFAKDNMTADECAGRLRLHRTAIEEAFESREKSVYIIRD